MSKHTIKFLLCIFTCYVSAAIYAWTADGENPWNLKPENVPVTEHRKFANPLSGKKPHLLFISMAQRLRDIQELSQRVECTYELWPWYKYDIFSPFGVEKLYAGVLNHVDYNNEYKKMFAPGKLKKFDGIVFGKVDIMLMPAKQRTLILNLVRNQGVPLFLFMMDSLPAPAIKGAVFKDYPVEFLNQFNPQLKNVKVKKAEWGKGAIYAVCFPKHEKLSIQTLRKERYRSLDTLVPVDSDHPLWYDYSMAFTGKFFLNVFQPQRVKIENLKSDGSFRFSAQPQKNYKLRYEIVDRFNRNIAAGTQDISKQKITIPADLPRTAAILNVFLCDQNGKVVDFAAAPLKTTVSACIASLKTNKEAYEADEPVELALQISGVTEGTLMLSMKDDRGRIIAQKELPAVPGKQKVTLRFPYSGSLYGEISAILKNKKQVLDEVRTGICFKDTADYLKDIRFLMWSSMHDSRVHNQVMKDYKKLGVDALYHYNAQWEHGDVVDVLKKSNQTGFWYSACLTTLSHRWNYQKLCNLSAWDVYQKTGKFKDENGNFCNSRLKSIESAMGRLKNKYGVLFYSLGDETVVGYGKESCYCKECLERFRSYVKKVYGTIDKLNHQYGTKYKSFAEVNGMSLEQAADAELIPMWIDYRMFIEEEFINWYRLCIDMIRKYDPKAIVGSEGYVFPARSVSGFNFYKMFPYTGFGAFYLNERDHVAAQYFPDGAIAGTILGAYEGLMNPGRLKHDVWYTLFEGFQTILWWRNYDVTTGYSNSANYGFMLQRLAQFELPMQIFSAIRKSGQGKLLISSRKHDYGIRVHYSNNCLHVNTVFPDKNTWDDSLRDFSSMLYSLGLTYKYINPQEVEAGIPENVKTLILPCSQAMSDAEVNQIKKFVQRGGLLITDYNPAVFNEHGKERDTNPMLPVFGKFSRLNIHKYGKGHAVYLDNYITGAKARIDSNSAAGLQEGMLRLFKLGGVTPLADVTDSRGIRQKFVIYEKDAEKYICMLGPIMEKGADPTSKAGAEAGIEKVAVGGTLDRTVKLSVPMHIYDMGDNGKYLGLKDCVQINLEPATGRILFCSPVKIGKPAIRLSSKKVTPEEKLTLTLSGFVNTAILKIYNPDGICVREIRVAPGKEYFVPAWNESAGEYKAELTNIAGGMSTMVSFTVKKP